MPDIIGTTNKIGSVTDAIVKDALGKIPGKPAELGETIYRLRFKKGRSPVQEIFFKFKRDQAEAERVAKIFCANWKYRCIWVEEFLTDILAVPTEWNDAGEPLKNTEVVEQ